VAGDAYILWKHRDNDYYGFVENIRETIPEGKRVWGSISFWIGLHDYPYRSQITPYADVLAFEPEFVILYDHDTWGEVSATVGRRIERNGVYDEIRSLMEKLCVENGEFVRRIDDRYYGNVEIFQICWDRKQGG
jgi:hypothetical protein